MFAPTAPVEWNKAVLVVDDSEVFATLVVEALAERGLPALAVDSAAAAVALIEAEPPMLVLSDFDMPGGNGLTLLEATRVSRPHLPFVLWSSTALPAVAAERARELEARVSLKLMGPDLDNLLRLALA